MKPIGSILFSGRPATKAKADDTRNPHDNGANPALRQQLEKKIKSWRTMFPPPPKDEPDFKALRNDPRPKAAKEKPKATK